MILSNIFFKFYQFLITLSDYFCKAKISMQCRLFFRHREASGAQIELFLTMTVDKMRYLRTRLLMALCLLLTGCSLFSRDLVVRICLPELPAQWGASFSSYEWQLCFPAPKGGLATRSLAGTLKEAVLALPKQRNLPVSARIVLSSGLRLPPAGGVYPLDMEADNGKLQLSWENGMLADLLLKLIAAKVDITTLNSRRLAEEIWVRSGGDPWRLDMDGMAAALAADLFTIYAIRHLPTCSVKVCPGAGCWFLESPWSVLQEADEAGGLELVDLPAGRHLLFAQGGGTAYLLWATVEGEVLLLPAEP
jgi:hypothetical protein